MARQEIINEIKGKTASFDAKSYNGFLAVQVTLRDSDEPFYVEIKDGKLSVEPYEYNDRQANMLVSSMNFTKMINKKLSIAMAVTREQLTIEGDTEKARELIEIIKAS